MPTLLASSTIGASVTITIPVNGARQTVIRATHFSYSTAFIGALTITQQDATVLFNLDIRGQGSYLSPGGIGVTLGQTVSIMLVGATGAIGKLVVEYDYL